MNELGDSFTVENKIGNLHKTKLLKPNLMNDILHHLKFKNLSKNWEKHVFHWENLNICKFVHTTKFWH